MKKLLSVILAGLIMISCCVPVFAENETETVTEIRTAEDLYNIRNNLDGKYILMNDIDLSVYENWEPIGTSDTPFTGNLNGNGFSILNMAIKGEYTDGDTLYFALFASMKTGSVIDLGILNVDIDVKFTGSVSESFRVGALAGYASNSTIDNCIVSGDINLEGFNEGRVGGFFGSESNCIPTGCANYADINFSSEKIFEVSIGGIAGRALGVFECCNYGKITVSSVDTDDSKVSVLAGGIVGEPHQFGCLINNCYNRGTINFDFSTPSTYVGGITGESIQFCNSYNSGEIILPENFKGFAGGIAGNHVFWVLAVYPGLPTENAYYINEGFYPSYADGYAPDDSDFKNAKLLTEEEFKKQESFVGFDFETVWEMEENGYPVLKNQPKINGKLTVNLDAGETYPAKITNCEWSISDGAIANIDSDGNIFAISSGTTVIAVTYAYGYTAEYTVNVKGSIEPEPVNNVKSAEIVYLPLKNRIVFGYGSPNHPDGIVLKLTYKDGTEKAETIVRKGNGYYAGNECVFGSVDIEVVRYGHQTETLYINDERTSVEYDYFVIPPIFFMIISFLQGELFVIA